MLHLGFVSSAAICHLLSSEFHNTSRNQNEYTHTNMRTTTYVCLYIHMYNGVQNNKYKLKHVFKASSILLIIILNSLLVS